MEIQATSRSAPPTIDPRWVGLGFAIFALALLAYALALAAPPAAGGAIFALALAAPALGLQTAPRSRPRRALAIALLLGCVALAFGAIALSGATASPLWPALIPPLFAALLLLPGLPGAGVAAALWLGYGALALISPPAARLDFAAAWLLRGVELGLVALLIERAVAAQRALSASSPPPTACASPPASRRCWRRWPAPCRPPATSTAWGSAW